MPDTLPLPIPYSAKKQEYESFLDTDSVLHGIIKVVDPSFTNLWGLSKRIEELYVLLVKITTHDHSPDNDAYTIAFDYQVANGISNGKIKLRELNKEVKI
jgi:hypothetical protein